MRLRKALKNFKSGRIVVGSSRKFYKCLPAPLEFALLLDDFLKRRRMLTKNLVRAYSAIPGWLTPQAGNHEAIRSRPETR